MTVVEAVEVTVGGRVVEAYDTGPLDGDRPTLLWHHGTLHTGRPLGPVLDLCARRGVRMITYARPGVRRLDPLPGHDVASVAEEVAAVLDAVEVERVIAMGASGGGPPSLACGALQADRVVAAATLASIAPYTGEESWFAGMASSEALRSALQGRAARASYAETAEFDRAVVVEPDWVALAGPWSELGADAGAAEESGPGGLIDDDMAWGRTGASSSIRWAYRSG